MNDDELRKILNISRDWNKMDNKSRASTLVLSFIKNTVPPKNIPLNVLADCLEAFNNNRGKFEIEVQSILEVLNESS